MTTIITVECPDCGDEHVVSCDHRGKECQYCGRIFGSKEERAEHELSCNFNE